MAPEQHRTTVDSYLLAIELGQEQVAQEIALSLNIGSQDDDES